uniref:Tc1-like transposase DDE domain-containing protein n=1 Tax=Esox lucius TaxID=8010 RepID=A0AAY5JYK7_ESOLU
MGDLHICEGPINVEQYIQVLEQHMLPSRLRLFQRRPWLFQQDNAKPHSAHITTAWHCSKRVQVLNWPVCSPDLSPIENIWRIMKLKILQTRQTVEQLKSYFKQEWETFHFPNYSNWSSQFLNDNIVLAKEEVMQH